MLHNFIPSYGVEINLELLASAGNSNAINAIQNDKAEKFIPKYSTNSANQVGSDFAGMDDGALKAKADQEILEAKASKTPTPASTIVQTSERQMLDNFEQTKIFEKAKEVYADPAKKLAEIVSKDCKETINEQKDPYTRETSTEEKTDIEYEEKTCEKPNNAINCERNLEVKCEVSQPCEKVGIKNVKGNLYINWNANTGVLIASTGGKGRHGCVYYNYHIDFEVEDKKRIKEFTLTNVAEDDYLQVKINGTSVFVGPWGGTVLNANPCELNAMRYQTPNTDLIPYLSDGNNKIEIVLVVDGLGSGSVQFKISANPKCCAKFKEEWTKRCWAN